MSPNEGYKAMILEAQRLYMPTIPRTMEVKIKDVLDLDQENRRLQDMVAGQSLIIRRLEHDGETLARQLTEKEHVENLLIDRVIKLEGAAKVHHSKMESLLDAYRHLQNLYGQQQQTIRALTQHPQHERPTHPRTGGV